MKNRGALTAFALLALFIVACGDKTEAGRGGGAARPEAATAGGARIRVDIFYLPHPPAVAILKKVEAVLKKYPSVSINEYDFTDPGNAERLEAHGLKEHTPIAFFINDKIDFTIDGRRIEFKNFPKGDAFVPQLEGSWTYDDIGKAMAAE